jgi:hypothetical protein
MLSDGAPIGVPVARRNCGGGAGHNKQSWHHDLPYQSWVATKPLALSALLVSAGSIVVFDSMVFHCGGVNLGDAPRRAVNTVFAIPLLAQQVAFTAKPDMDATLRRRLGLDYQPARSADAWREARAARLHRGTR